MKICVVTCTWFRPFQLGQLIRCFLEQDNPAEQCEMIILDDAGQYEHLRGDRWQLVSVPRRFKTLGEKRNATIALVSDDTEAICIWDDDDLYLPWHLRAAAAALERAPWSRPSQILYEHLIASVRFGHVRIEAGSALEAAQFETDLVDLVRQGVTWCNRGNCFRDDPNIAEQRWRKSQMEPEGMQAVDNLHTCALCGGLVLQFPCASCGCLSSVADRNILQDLDSEQS